MAVADATANYEQMGPTLLAQQPVTMPLNPQKEEKNWTRIYQHLESRLNMLRNWRYARWAYWAVLARFFLPSRYLFLVTPNRMWRGSPVNDAIIDSTGLQAVRTCASGMWSGMTNPARPWLKLDKALPWVELDPDAKAWIEDTLERVYAIMSQSNFYTAMATAFKDLVVFACAPGIIYEDFEDVIRLYIPQAGEYYLAMGARLTNDTLYREFTYSVTEIVEFAGHANCPQQVQKQWEEGGGSLEVEYVVCHAIEPNFPISGQGSSRDDIEIAVLPDIFTWRELYWLKGIKTPRPLSKRGFFEQPHFSLRWADESNNAYGGNGPCMDALGDTKQVQTQTFREAEYIEKGVRPPMGASPELKNEPASILPAQITYFSTDNAKKGFFPLFEVAPQWVAVLRENIAEVNARIKSCLFVDIFMAITQMAGVQPRNELELTKRDLERLQALGPVIELVEGQLKIAIRRILAIADRRRLLKPLPESLHGVPLKIEFVSIMRLAQKSAEAIGIKDFVATVGEMSEIAKEAGVPSAARVVKWDDTTRKLAEATNFQSDLLWTPGEVLEHDKARAKATAQQAAPGQAMAAVQAAKTLSETSTGGGTALSALTGSPSGTPAAPGV